MKEENINIDIHDRVAEAYYGKLGEKMQKETQERMHWIRDNVSGDNILDVGCSQGIGPILLGKNGKKVIGVDISQKAVEEANEALLKEDSNIRKNVNFIMSDFLKFDAKKEKFDTITITEVLEHLYTPDEFISKSYSLLEDKGTIIVTVPFAINDFPDHKKTYYYHDLYQMLYRYFEIKKTTFFGRWIGFVGKKRPVEVSSAKSIDLAILKQIEDNFYKIDREQNDINSECSTQLNNANEKYRNASRAIEIQKKKIEEINKKYRNASRAIEIQKKKIEEINEKSKELSSIILDKDSAIRKNLAIAQEYKHKNFEYQESASFQLGYLLIHKTRTVKDLILLPKRLFAIKTKKKLAVQTKGKLKKIIPLRANMVHNFTTVKDTSMLNVACIMDPFTYGSYATEANFKQLTPQNWKNELIEFSPDMLFIESAWRGKDELWWNSVGKKCDELVDIITYCNKYSIPTSFWNKEDPVHFNTFINTAALFDFVFTTDIDMIEKYKIMLQHNNVYLLPFACQPKLNNPIEKYNRKDMFCFAGAYYARYPERTKDLDEFMHHLPNLKPIEIYDRNYTKDDSDYKFPKQFKPFIVGSLPFEEIDKAYKGYNYAINLNSVKQSQSMFARRVYEVLASNTITISNFSKAVRLLFGDLVITSDNGLEVVNRVESLTSDNLYLKKHKLLGLRKVLMEHTYEDRLNFVVSKVFNKKIENMLPLVYIICFSSSNDSSSRCIKSFSEQTYTNKKLLIIQDKQNDSTENIINFEECKDLIFSELCSEGEYISFWNENDLYEKNYLIDLALATKYFDGEMIGKGCYYKYNGNLILNNNQLCYQNVDSLSLSSSIVKKRLIENHTISKLKLMHQSFLDNINGLSIDEFNYCKNGINLDTKNREIISANDIVSSGVSINKLMNIVQNQTFIEKTESLSEYISAETLVKDIKQNKDIKIKPFDSDIEVISTQQSDKHQNIYSTYYMDIASNGWDRREEIYFNTGLGLDIQLLITYSDEKKVKISHQHIMPNKNERLSIPTNAKWLHFGFRVKGNGKAVLYKLEFEYPEVESTLQVAQSEHLVLTNIYPSYSDLYRNGFVHTRVKAYKKEGINVDVFTLQDNKPLSYYEFENIDVTVGSADILRNLLTHNSYKSILVHFLDETMWSVIKDYIGKTKIFVWIHGSEIQPWYRRAFNYQNDDELRHAKSMSNKRMRFWKSILKDPHQNLKLIFVSNYFAEEVQEDLKLKIPAKNMTVIHNYINTSLFQYIDKDVEQRKRILSIRPYASRIYANDLIVKAILELSNKMYFNDLEFHLIGDGKLFDETVTPLKKFKNVKITKSFLSHSQIVQLHQEYGLFLVPSRADTQGVSRDEAMSSGLVPLTNAVTAIPEFVDDSCGVLAKGDDAKGLAEGIAKLYENPDLFKKMSKAAANRVRNQCDYVQTIQKELALFSTIYRETENDK